MNTQLMNELHKTQLEILDEIVRICRIYELTYYLAGGSVLGAVRHQGFIPWDDDVDVMMPRRDYNLFLEKAKVELNEKFYIDNVDENDEYYLFFSKIKKRNTIFKESAHGQYPQDKMGIFVDVFPLDDTQNDNSMMLKIQDKIIGSVKGELLYTRMLRRKPVSFLQKIKRLVLSPFSSKRLLDFIISVAQIQNNTECDYYINFGSQYGYKRQTMLKSIYGKPVKLLFEGEYYNVPEKYDEFLKKLYGEDYMSLPPIEKRIMHNPLQLSFDGINFEKID